MFSLEKFGDRLREARRAKGLTQESLALEVDGAQNDIWKYESKGRLPKLFRVCQLALALDVSVDWLVGRS